ncbi:MAG: F0F1 ATP synthase subunit alpha, partial [Bacteroidota bacterium]
YLGTRNLLRDVPVNKVKEFETEFLGMLDAQHKNVLETLRKGVIDDSVTSVLEKVAKELSGKYKA